MIKFKHSRLTKALRLHEPNFLTHLNDQQNERRLNQTTKKG